MISFKTLLVRSIVQNSFLKRSLSSEIKKKESLFQSSLYLSSREESFSVVQPAFSKKYLEDVASNLEEIRENLSLRKIDHLEFNTNVLKDQIHKYIDESGKLKKIRKKRAKIVGLLKKRPTDDTIPEELEACKAELSEIRKRFFVLEDIVVPFLLNLPAPIDFSRCGETLGEWRGSLDKETASKLGPVNHLRLGYFNNALQPSIVGPDAYYLTQDGAQTFHAITDYLLDLFYDYEIFSGMDLIKSAIVEAVNSKPFAEDIFLLNDDHPVDFQRLHLTGEGSLGALIAWLVSKSTITPNKFIQSGSSYGDKLSQTHCISATIVEHEDKISEAQENLYELWWNAFKAIGFRCRSYYVPLEQLKKNESSKLIIALWLYSKHEWLPVLELSNHSNYILRRAGVADESLHLLCSTLDFLPLMKCWLEHFQDPETGKVSRPEVLESYYLSP